AGGGGGGSAAGSAPRRGSRRTARRFPAPGADEGTPPSSPDPSRRTRRSSSRASGFEDLDVAAALVTPVPEAEGASGHPVGRAAAELARQDRLGIGQTRHRDGDVVEQDRAHRD